MTDIEQAEQIVAEAEKRVGPLGAFERWVALQIVRENGARAVEPIAVTETIDVTEHNK